MNYRLGAAVRLFQCALDVREPVHQGAEKLLQLQPFALHAAADVLDHQVDLFEYPGDVRRFQPLRYAVQQLVEPFFQFGGGGQRLPISSSRRPGRRWTALMNLPLVPAPDLLREQQRSSTRRGCRCSRSAARRPSRTSGCG